jgi:hypothetical protein
VDFVNIAYTKNTVKKDCGLSALVFYLQAARINKKSKKVANSVCQNK